MLKVLDWIRLICCIFVLAIFPLFSNHFKNYKNWKQFKALEAMAEQVKPEGYATNAQSHSSNKLEKNVAKPRGSGSPFKCIGLGLGQQMKLEKDEDLTAARLHIEELESLAANRQKEVGFITWMLILQLSYKL